MSRKNFQKAVIIGGSITGLLTAYALADNFDEVIIIEKDLLPTTPTPHKSVPQGHHVHVIYGSALELIESWFPGIVAEMVTAGANVIDFSKDLPRFFQGKWTLRYNSGVKSLLSLRPHVEWHLRCRLLAAYPNVSIREHCTVEGFQTNDNSACITGVKYKDANGQTATINADITVDASGRGSQTPAWLAAIGYSKPKEAAIEINLGYTTRMYQCPSYFQENWKGLVLYPECPYSWRSGMILSVQNNQWIVSLAGYFGDHAPSDDTGFLEFARSLPQPHIYNWLKNEIPLSASKVFKVQQIRRRYYEAQTRFPNGLIVIGDALCLFNPVFGQGITIASICVAELRSSLAMHLKKSPRDLKGFSYAFQRKLAKHLYLPWHFANIIHFGYPQTKGSRPLLSSMLFRPCIKAMEGCSENRRIHQTFLKVLQMYAGFRALLTPSFLIAVMQYIIKSAFWPLMKRTSIQDVPRSEAPNAGQNEAHLSNQ